MSAVAIVSVAALCAGYLWVERRTVRRLAVQRREHRRGRGVLCWDGSLCRDATGTSQGLAQALEQTVAAADVVWAIHDRLFSRGSPGESPFEVRRARVNGTWRIYVAAAQRLRLATDAWLAGETEPDHPQRRMAVERVDTWLAEQELGARWGRGEDLAVAMDVAVDVLENALANLSRGQAAQTEGDPFRFATAADAPIEPGQRQDVSAPVQPQTPRRSRGARASAAR